MGCGSSVAPNAEQSTVVHVGIASSPSAAKTLLGSPVSEKICHGIIEHTKRNHRWEEKQPMVETDTYEYDAYGPAWAQQCGHNERVYAENALVASNSPTAKQQPLDSPKLLGGMHDSQSLFGAESQIDEHGGLVGTISRRQAVSMMGDESSQKHLESRLQAHHQIYLNALQNREIALQNRRLELQNEELQKGLTETLQCEDL